MNNEQNGGILVRSRVMEIGYQVLPLANISRIQSLHYQRNGTVNPGHVIIIVVALLFGVIGAAATSSSRSVGADDQTAVFLVVAAVVVVAALVHALTRKLDHYVLVIETSGAQSVGLVSDISQEILRLKYAVVSAIENPPESGNHMYVRLGDHVEISNSHGFQVGQGNVQNDNVFGPER